MAEKQNQHDDINKSDSKGHLELYKNDSKSNDNIIIIKSSRYISKNNSNLSINNNDNNVYHHGSQTIIDLQNQDTDFNNITVTIPGSVEPSKNEVIEDIINESTTVNNFGFHRVIASNKSIHGQTISNGAKKKKIFLQNDLLTNESGATALIIQETPDIVQYLPQLTRKTTSFNENYNKNSNKLINKSRPDEENTFSNLSSLSKTKIKQNIEMTTTGIPAATTITIQKLSATSLTDYQEQQLINNIYNASHSNSCNIENIENNNNTEQNNEIIDNIINRNFPSFLPSNNTSLNTNDTKSLLYNARTTGTASINSVGSIICRICHNNDPPERLISPCLCKGTLAYVHRYCLEHWLSRAGILHCELCMHRFRTEHTLRYGCWESVRVWFRHPNNRGLLQSDFLVCSLLTIVTFGLITISAFGLQNFLRQSNHIGLSKIWTQGSIFIFLFIVMSAYGVNVYMIIKGQTIPWFRWWQSARHVRLILTDYTPADRVQQQEQRIAERQRLIDTQVQQQTIVTIQEETPIAIES